jgi:hypothetical protein
MFIAIGEYNVVNPAHIISVGARYEYQAGIDEWGVSFLVYLVDGRELMLHGVEQFVALKNLLVEEGRAV